MIQIDKWISVIFLTGVLFFTFSHNVIGQQLRERTKKESPSELRSGKKKKQVEPVGNKIPDAKKLKVQFLWGEDYPVSMILTAADGKKETLDLIPFEEKSVELSPKNYELTIKSPRFKSSTNRDGSIVYEDYVIINESDGSYKITHASENKLLVEYTSKEEKEEIIRIKREAEEAKRRAKEQAENEERERINREKEERRAREEQAKIEQQRIEKEFNNYLSVARISNSQNRCTDVIKALGSAKAIRLLPLEYENMFKECKIKTITERAQMEFKNGNKELALKLLNDEYASFKYTEFKDLINEYTLFEAKALEQIGKIDEAISLVKLLESNAKNTDFLNSLISKKEDIDYMKIMNNPENNYGLMEFCQKYPKSSRIDDIRMLIEKNFSKLIEQKLYYHRYEEANEAIGQAEKNGNLISTSFRKALENYKSRCYKYRSIKSSFAACADLPIGINNLEINETASYSYTDIQNGIATNNMAIGIHLLKKTSLITPFHFTIERVNVFRIPGKRPFRLGIGLEYYRMANYNTKSIQAISYDTALINFSNLKLNNNSLVNRFLKINLIWIEHQNFQFYTPIGFALVKFNPSRAVEIEKEPTDLVTFKKSGLGIGARLRVKLGGNVSAEFQIENSSPFYKTSLFDSQFESEYRSSIFTIKPASLFLQGKLNINHFYFSYMLFRSFNQLVYLGLTTDSPGSLNAFKSSTFGVGFNFN